MQVALTNAVSPWLVENYPFVDFELALLQQDAYCKKLADHGVQVKRLKVNCGCPDGCFIEDTAVVVDELAILTNMGCDSRHSEPEAIETELAKYRQVEHISPDARLEGGDILQLGRTIFVGLSSRTNMRAVEELERILGPLDYSLVPVTVKGGLHLKTACTALDDETLLVNPRWVDTDPFKAWRVLDVPEEEPMGANTLRVDDTILLHEGFPKTVELVHKNYERTEVLDIEEFMKANAGLSCLSLIFEQPESGAGQGPDRQTA
jgi:dimethylargininase